MKKLAGVLLLLMATACATYLNIREPIELTGMAENDSISIGTVGPGQTIYLIADRATIDATGTNINYNGWDKLAISELPPGWISEDSPWYESPMEAKIRVSPDAKDGEYIFKATAIDEGNYDNLGNLSINVKVVVSKNVFSIDVTPAEVETGVGQPAVYYVDIENAGAASDTFSITSSGVPAWTFRKDVLVPHAVRISSPAMKTFTYEVLSNEETNTLFTINVTSLSSDQLSQQRQVRLVATPSLVSDYRATGHGLLVFPLLEDPIYSIMAFISNSKVFG